MIANHLDTANNGSGGVLEQDPIHREMDIGLDAGTIGPMVGEVELTFQD